MMNDIFLSVSFFVCNSIQFKPLSRKFMYEQFCYVVMVTPVPFFNKNNMKIFKKFHLLAFK